MVRYECRRCGRRLGVYNGAWTDPELGLTGLSTADQAQLLEWDDRGAVVTVKVLCDHCLPLPWDDNLWYN
jgi:hypothetical protein